MQRKRLAQLCLIEIVNLTAFIRVKSKLLDKDLMSYTDKYKDSEMQSSLILLIVYLETLPKNVFQIE